MPKLFYYYAVRTGRRPGVYRTWDEAAPLVHGFAGASHKKFAREDEARAFVNGTALVTFAGAVALKARKKSSLPASGSSVVSSCAM